jgi:hypothetical protein
MEAGVTRARLAALIEAGANVNLADRSARPEYMRKTRTTRVRRICLNCGRCFSAASRYLRLCVSCRGRSHELSGPVEGTIRSRR